MLWNCKTDVMSLTPSPRAELLPQLRMYVTGLSMDCSLRVKAGHPREGVLDSAPGGSGDHCSLPLLTPCVQQPHVPISVPLSPLMGTLPVDLP